jgi:PAS domain S-box-containing protein
MNALRPLRVLLLEDSPDDAGLILHELRRAGFEPIGDRVETERDFLAHLDPAPEIILSDYHLPQFDALQALRLVRERGVDVPVILVTGAVGEEAAVECLRQGAVDYLLKDRLARLGQAVTHALEGQQARAGRRRAEAALRDSEARKTAILETAVEGILTIDERGLIESLNPAAERLFGYSADEVLGQNVKMLMPSPYREEHDRYLDSYLTTGRSKILGIGREVFGCKKDGTTFPMELALSEVLLGDRRLFTGMIRDISDRKQAEQRLKFYAAELEERNAVLARSNQDLNDFAHVASHDLQEPLRMVSRFTQRLAQRYQDRLDEKANQYIEFAVEGCHRMQGLIQDLLAYSRVNTQGQPPEPVDSVAVLARTLGDLRVAIAEAGAEITHDLMPTVAADATQLGQLFQNLIGNALKFRSAEPPRIHISARRDDGLWTFGVADNGIGIDPAYFERIFTVFQRLHTREEYPGTGIGLAVCKKIVERHGGRIWVESTLGQGTTFFFTLGRPPEPEDPARTAVGS